MTIVGFALGLGLTAFLNMSRYLRETYLDILMVLPLLLITNLICYLTSVLAVSLSTSSLEAYLMIFYTNLIEVFIYLCISTITETYSSSMYTYAPGILVYTLGNLNNYNSALPIYGIKNFGPTMIELLNLLAIWIGLTFLAYYFFKEKKSEHLGTAKMEKFGGQTALVVLFSLVYLYIGRSIEYSYVTGTVISFISVAIAYFVDLFILRRKVAITKKDLITFAIVSFGFLAAGVLLRFIKDWTTPSYPPDVDPIEYIKLFLK